MGSTITTPLFFFMPQAFPHNFLIASVFGALYGLILACFVPLSALAPALATTEDGLSLGPRCPGRLALQEVPAQPEYVLMELL